jgi:hypothetical protein
MTFSKNEIRVFTKLLHESDDPMWARIRQLLAERGIKANTSFLVESFPDDTSFYFGVLITQDGLVIQYGFDYLGKPVQEGEFTEWQDLTDSYQNTPYFESVETGMELQNAQ